MSFGTHTDRDGRRRRVSPPLTKPPNKHFDRAIHYLRDLVQLRRVIPVFVRTHLQRADGLTKALDKSKYFDWLKMFFT